MSLSLSFTCSSREEVAAAMILNRQTDAALTQRKDKLMNN